MKWTEKQIEDWLTTERREIRFRDGVRSVEMDKLGWSDFDFMLKFDRTIEEIVGYAHEESDLQGWSLEEAFVNVVAFLGNQYKSSS